MRAIEFSLALAACGGGSHAVIADAYEDAGKAGPCAATFGSALTPGFGRFDATILAVVPPGDESCAEPNATHLVVQGTIDGAVYRMVVDVLSSQGSPDVWFHEFDAPLVGEAWAEGWHTDVPLDYVTTLGLTSTAFTEMMEQRLVSTITTELELGAHISVFATNDSTEPDSAHLVHRNATNQDGAIVISPDIAPHWLTMRFDEQTF